MLTSAPAVPSSSAAMQRGGRSWRETLRIGLWRVAHLRAECAALSFVQTGLIGQWTGLTGGWGRPLSTGLTGEVYRSDRL